MKLFELKAKEGLPEGDNPWEDVWDCYYGFVVRTETEAEARTYADACEGRENNWDNTRHPWLDEKYSTCIELKDEGEAGIVLSDFKNG